MHRSLHRRGPKAALVLCSLLLPAASCTSFDPAPEHVYGLSAADLKEWKGPGSVPDIPPDEGQLAARVEAGIAAYNEAVRQDRPQDPQGRIDGLGRERAFEPTEAPSGFFYAGVSYTRNDLGDSATKLQHDLNERGAGRDVHVELDDSGEGFKGYVGYRFVTPFAIELGYTGLEGSDSKIRTSTVDSTLANDIGELHPFSGRGPSLSFLAYPYDDGRWSAFGKIGVWYWQSELNVDLNGTLVEYDREDWDALLGVGVQCRLFSGLSVRAELERYLLRDEHADILSLGLLWRF